MDYCGCPNSQSKCMIGALCAMSIAKVSLFFPTYFVDNTIYNHREMSKHGREDFLPLYNRTKDSIFNE